MTNGRQRGTFRGKDPFSEIGEHLLGNSFLKVQHEVEVVKIFHTGSKIQA